MHSGLHQSVGLANHDWRKGLTRKTLNTILYHMAKELKWIWERGGGGCIGGRLLWEREFYPIPTGVDEGTTFTLPHPAIAH